MYKYKEADKKMRKKKESGWVLLVKPDLTTKEVIAPTPFLSFSLFLNFASFNLYLISSVFVNTNPI